MTREQKMEEALKNISQVFENSKRAKSKGGNEYTAEFLRTLVIPLIEDALEAT